MTNRKPGEFIGDETEALLAQQEASQHDPGGKALFPLPEGVVGAAAISNDGLCRFALTRERITSDPVYSPQHLWIGLNPSTANPDMDDPTIRVEWNLTQRSTGHDHDAAVQIMDQDGPPSQRGLGPPPKYVKMNVLPFRLTDPAWLDRLMMGLDHADGEERNQSIFQMQALVSANWLAVIEEASKADRVIVAWGKPRSKMVMWQCMQLLSMLRASYTGVLWCVGLLQDNWPAHPLRRKCILEPYRVNPSIDGVPMEKIMRANIQMLAKGTRQRL